LTPWNSYDTYYPSTVVSLLESEDNSTTTVFGGIAAALKSYYKTSIVLHPTKNGTSLNVNGVYGQQIQPASSGWNEDGTPIVLANTCNQYFTSFGSYNNPSDFMLDAIRATLFYTSIYASDMDTDPSPTNHQSLPNVKDFIGLNKYHVLWVYWGAHVAVTLSIVLFIIPTFYGFWTLARQTTLSPFETARAFHAPILQDAPRELDTKRLLKEVGRKNLHTDLGGAAQSPVEKSEG
jgi:hypothetical protein